MPVHALGSCKAQSNFIPSFLMLTSAKYEKSDDTLTPGQKRERDGLALQAKQAAKLAASQEAAAPGK